MDKKCCHDKKLRSSSAKKKLDNRLSRIEGQVRGLRRMIEEDAYCPKILMECSAATAALHAFSRVLLEEHISTCVAEDIRKGNDETIEELTALLQKLLK